MDNEKHSDELTRVNKIAEHYRLLLDDSMDPTFSFYPSGTYRYVNKAFAEGVGKPVEEIIGHTIWDVFGKEEADKRYAVLSRVFSEGKTLEFEVRVPLPTGETYYLTTVKPVFNEAGEVETVICTSKNITKRKLAEDALKEQHERLLQAVKEIKTLSGLLPICARCKKIRDSEDYWYQVEEYISSHSGAEFSHTICPDCIKEIYPEMASRVPANKEFKPTDS